MKKFLWKTITITAFLSCMASGCQKAPEISSAGSIPHAKDSMEGQIEDIVNSSEPGSGICQDTDPIRCLIGKEENGLRIEAPAPYIPEHIYHMVLTANDGLTMDRLESFLESPSGSIQDLSQQRQEEAAQADKENSENPEFGNYPFFGDESISVITDGEKEAGFSGHTGGYYKDHALMEKCSAIYKSGTETAWDAIDGETFPEADFPQASGFPVKDAEKILLDKLAKLDITEISIYHAAMYQSDSFLFYEINFTPSYDGMGSVWEFGSNSPEAMYQLGTAWVCREGIASLHLPCLGKAAQKEEYETLLSWEQIEQVIKANITSGKIHGSAKAVLSEVKFLYYPIFHEEQNEVEMVPVWHIYIPSSVWIQDPALSNEIGTGGALWNICIHAASGEIVRME